MSATEVIAELKKLPADERLKVLRFLRADSSAESSTTSDGISPEFAHAADEVFTKNAALFHKLAQ